MKTHRSPLFLLLAAAGCTAASQARYVHRIGTLAGERAVVDGYERALLDGRPEAIVELFDRDPTAQRCAAGAALELREALAPLLAAGGTIDGVEADLRDVWTLAEPPAARISLRVAGADGSGARRLVEASCAATFREVGRGEPDREGVAPARLVIVDQDPFTVTTRTLARPRFEDATAAAGLRDRHRNQEIDGTCLILQGTMPGSGAAAADFDLDGDVDLIAIDGKSSRAYANWGAGTFEDRSERWGLAAITGAGCVSADYDDDGDEDLYVLDHFGGTKLLRNERVEREDCVFVDVTAETGAGVADPTFSAAFADVDRDGDLDLYVPAAGDYYSQVPMPPFMARDGRPNRLFINDGAGRFTEEAAARGVDDVGWGLACGFCDYDGDGDDDLYLANDFGLNSLYRNDGTGHFTDVAVEAGASDRGYGMGVSWGDVDLDGDLDLYVSNIFTEYAPVFADPDYPLPFMGRLFRGWVGTELYRMGLGNSLLLNEGDGTFTDVAKKWRVNDCGWAWAGMFLDYDDDGDLDVYCPDGSFTGEKEGDLELSFWSLSSLMWERSKLQEWLFDAQGRSLQGRERNRLFEQVAPGEFVEVAALHGVNAIETGRGLAIADFTGDGRLDLYLRNLDDEARFFRNTGGEGSSLTLKLVGGGDGGAGSRRSTRDAIGAIARVTAGGATQTRQVTAGEGFYSSHDKRLHFGLGEATEASVEITWPSGLVERIESLPAGRSYRIREGHAEEDARDLLRVLYTPDSD